MNYVAGSISDGGTITSEKLIQHNREKITAVADWIRKNPREEVYDPCTTFAGDITRSWAEYMKESLPHLIRAKRVVLVKGWHRSKGATIEAFLALLLDIPLMQAEVEIEDEGWQITLHNVNLLFPLVVLDAMQDLIYLTRRQIQLKMR